MYVLKVKVGSQFKFVSYFANGAVVVSDFVEDAMVFPSRSTARIYAGLMEDLVHNLNLNDLFLPLSVDDEDLVEEDVWFSCAFVDVNDFFNFLISPPSGENKK